MTDRENEDGGRHTASLCASEAATLTIIFRVKSARVLADEWSFC